MGNRWLYATAAVVVLGAGCQSGSLSLNFHDHTPVHHSHVCTHACDDHYYDGRRVVVIHGGHHHGPDCGHYWDGTYWVVVRESHPHRRVTHVCTHRCNHHYYDGGKLVVINRAHRHGPNCGHYWDGKYWVKGRERVDRSRSRPGPHKARPRR